MLLTDVMCKKAQPQEKQYRLSDTNGLSLRIDPNGKKYWSIRYTEHGQRKEVKSIRCISRAEPKTCKRDSA